MMSMNCFLLIGFATVPMLFSFVDDLKCDLNAIQRSLHNKTKRKKMIEPLSKFSQFHSDTKRLARDYSDFWQIMLTLVCSYYIVGICSELLLVKIKMVIRSLILKILVVQLSSFCYNDFSSF